MRQPRHTRTALALACGSYVLLWSALALLNPRPIADEEEHLPVIECFARGDWSAAAEVPMLPTYHLVAAGATGWCGAPLLAVRGLNVLLACAAAFVLALGLNRGAAQQTCAADRLLHFAWNPLLVPFVALAYTDVAGVLPIVAALALHERRRYAWSGAALLVACLIRQTSVVWVAFFVAWALWTERRSAAARIEVAARLWLHVAILVVAAAALLIFGRLTIGPTVFNRMEFNPAQLYCFAIFVALLGLPLWAVRAPAVWRELARGWLMRPVGVAATIAAVAALALAFQSPHAWNYDFDYVRNWPLEAMRHWPLARLAGAVLIVALAPVVVRFVAQQPRRRELTLVGVFTLLFLLPQSVAEPRYYIVPTLLVLWLVEWTPAEARRITCWFATLSIGIAVFVVVHGSSRGGVW